MKAVLLMESDSAKLVTLSMILRSFGYEVLEAPVAAVNFGPPATSIKDRSTSP